MKQYLLIEKATSQALQNLAFTYLVVTAVVALRVESPDSTGLLVLESPGKYNYKLNINTN